MLVGFTELRDLTQAELAPLPDDELQREFGSDSRRKQFQCGRALLRLMLQDWTGKPAIDHKLTTEEGGKPLCLDGPAISITHGGDRVACSIAESGQIGIDLERIDREREVTEIAQRFFSSEERAWLDAQPREGFFMLWVLKEAFVKAHGQSVFGGLQKLRCVVQPPGIDAQVLEAGYCDLSLFGAADMFLALATTEVPLDSVGFRHWVPGTARLNDSNNYKLIATTNDRAKRTAA